MEGSLATLVSGGPIGRLGKSVIDRLRFVGDVSLFALFIARWLASSLPARRVFVPLLYEVGVRSVPVVLVTGAFIGMVLAAQSYDQLHLMRLEATIGSVINLALVKELGPTLAATMLAGRVGSAMAAELGTMRVTEQIDAIRMLGANPIHYLVTPRVLACCLLIPLLTIISDFAGILGGWIFSTQCLGVPSPHYWLHSIRFVSWYDVAGGIFKSGFFGAAIAVVSCHRGFHCDAGAEGVGKAATEAFVYSFVLILMLDFILGVFLLNLEYLLRVLHVPIT